MKVIDEKMDKRDPSINNWNKEEGFSNNFLQKDMEAVNFRPKTLHRMFRKLNDLLHKETKSSEIKFE